jgi:hypothetical protein
MVRMRVRPSLNAAVAFAFAVLLTLGCAERPVYDPNAEVPPVYVPAELLTYSPLLPRLPVAAGIYYPPEWRYAEMTGWASGDPRVRFKLGSAAVALFDQIAAALFAQVQSLPSWPRTEGGTQLLDLVLVPRIVQSADAFVGYTLGVDLYSVDASPIAGVATKLWYIPETEIPDSGSPGDPARIAQIRLKEGLAALSTSLIASVELEQWARRRGVVWHWPEAAPGAAAGVKASGVAIVQRTKQRTFSASAQCTALGEALNKLDPQLHVVPTAQLTDVLYPWLSSADLDDVALFEQLRRPAVIERARTNDIRHLVLARTPQSRSEEHGGGAPIGGPGGAGLFGLMWWSRHEAGDLRVLDLLSTGEARVVSHQREVPTFALPAFILPIPIPLPPGEAMADTIAKQLLPILRPAP